MEQQRKDTFNIEEFLGYFLDETQELIQQMDRDILQLEQSDASNLDPRLIDRMFRIAHTIKGSSGMVRLTEIPKISHRMEDILDKLRKNQISLSDELVDLLLESVDVIKILVKEVSENKKEISTVSEVISKIDAFLKKLAEVEKEEPEVRRLQPPQDNVIPGDSEAFMAQEESAGELKAKEYISKLAPYLTEYEEIRLTEAIENQLNIYVISFTVSEDKVHDATTNLLAELNNLGEVVTVSPKQIEQGRMQFEIVLTTDYDIKQVRNGITSQDVVIKRLHIEKESPPEKKISPPVETPNEVGEEKLQPKEQYTHTLPSLGDVLLPPPVEQIVRVKIQELDNLMNLVGELVINRSAIVQIGEEIFKRMGDGSKDLKNGLRSLLKELGKLTNSLQQSIMKSRMVPISQIFNNYPRLVRDLAKRNDKEIQLLVRGEGTELDKKIMEEINDPLVHLIRNACDHGIEKPEEREKKWKPRTGAVTLNAYQEGSQIIIEVEDDGGGIDAEVIRTKAIEKGLLKEDNVTLTNDEILRFIIKPGFTTVEQATDVSGRGVGMDVVSTNVSKLGGSLNMQTEVDKGAKFTIRLPLTLAIMEVFLVRVKSETYAIPLLDVYRHERIERSQIKTVGSKEVLELVDEEEIIPLLRISEIFDLPEHKTEQTKQSRFSGPAERSEPIYVVVVVSSGRKVGLVVDAIIGQQEIVIKPLCESIGKVPGIAGATILGNGDVVLIIDVSFLVLPETHFLSETRFLKENGFLIRNWNDERLDESRKHKILVFELNEQEYGIDVSYVKTINPLTKITHVPKTPPCLLGVMNLHGRIIPVVDLYRRFDIEESHKAKMFVIVVLVDGKEIGLLVDRASDVRNVAFDEILPPPPDAISVDVTYIDGIFQLKSEKQRKMIILLNLEQIFRNPFPQRKRVSANF